jgi:hypothetical protein
MPYQNSASSLKMPSTPHAHGQLLMAFIFIRACIAGYIGYPEQRPTGTFVVVATTLLVVFY